MMDNEEQKELDAIGEVPGVPKRALSTYARLWQFETWLRRMVYVELRALLGSGWNSDMPRPTKAYESDKRLIHMPTPEMDALSFAQLSMLEKVIEKKLDPVSTLPSTRHDLEGQVGGSRADTPSYRTLSSWA
jgi:hypothetical protein